MTNSINILTLELKKPRFITRLLYILLILIILFIASCLFTNNPKSSCLILLNFIPYIILFSSCFSLGSEFEASTSQMIFTGIYTRTEIIIAKMIKTLSTCLVIFLLYEILSFGIALYYGLSVTIYGVFRSLLVFLAYGYIIASFEFLVSSISLSGIASGLITYLCFFDIMNVLLSNALSSHISEIFKNAIRNSIFYIANTGFYSQTYTIKEFVILFISATIILILSCVIFKRKNL